MTRNILTDAECAWLERLERDAGVEGADLTPWEQGFLADLLARFHRYGDRTHISPKQWALIARISEKVIP
jgi:hypothetical protein